MKIWIKNTKENKIVCGISMKKGCSAIEQFENFLQMENIQDRENYKIIYKNPFIRYYD